MIRIAVCDDEKDTALAVSTIVEEELKSSEISYIIDRFQDGQELLAAQKQNPYDAIFLDIMMPEISGFDVADKINSFSSNTYIIFVTSQNELVHKSFDYQPFNFVSKNLDSFKKDLRRIIRKLLHHLNQNNIITINIGYQENKDIKIMNIMYLESDGHYVLYRMTDDSVIRSRDKLSSRQNELAPYDFIKVHKKYIVNMKYITMIDKSNNQVEIGDSTCLSIARSQKEILLESYKLYKRKF